MILYLIKSTLCLLLMLIVYLLVLQQERVFRFNRFYLLFSVIASFAIPFIAINSPLQIGLELSFQTISDVINDHIIGANKTNAATGVIVTNNNGVQTQTILYVIYAIIASAFIIRLIRNVYLIIHKALKNKRLSLHSAKLVLLKSNAVSHTFWNYIFLDENEYLNRTIEKEVFTHELAHAKQKHTLDILFIELLQAIFWFNPILIFYKRAIRMNHEFLADEAVVLAYNKPANYQRLLLNKIATNSRLSLISGLNYHITKKRLIMLSLRSVNKKILLFKKMTTFPIILLAIFLFSTGVVAGDDALTVNKKSDGGSYKKDPSHVAINKNVNINLDEPIKTPQVDIDKSLSLEITPPG